MRKAARGIELDAFLAEAFPKNDGAAFRLQAAASK